jgi:branched-chain amino acid transport system ATP-binding protein
MSLLQADRLNSYYGDSHILFDVSLRIEKNEVVALLGRNGAGKSTTLKTLMGVIKPRTGTIMLDGKPTQDLPPHAIAALGVQLVPEDRRVFGSLNVEENLVLARLTTGGPSTASGRCFPALRNAAAAAERICRVASNKCWRSLARSSATRS